MSVEKTERDITMLVTQVADGEIKLPEIQRAYIWKPTQVAKLIESLYRGYPSGSLLFWRTMETPQTRDAAIDTPTGKPAVQPLYLLDGQQRLTSLHRVLNDHPDAQIVFNVETEAFQNQSAATKQDARWVKVYDLFRQDADLLEVMERFDYTSFAVERRECGRRLQRLMAVPKYGYHMEIITDLPYGEVAQIFVRVNSGGRALKTTDLALATLSARWPGVLRKLEDEAAYWRKQGYGDLDVTFLTRALTGAVLGRGLSAWSHSRLAAAPDEELEAGWATVQRGLRALVPLLKQNLRVSHSSLLTSINVLLPPVVLLGERPKDKLSAEDANGIIYWFLIATIRTRYSSSADTQLGLDIPAARKADPVRELIGLLGIGGARVEITPSALIGRTVASPYFFLGFLAAQANGATDWWHGVEIGLGGEGDHKIEYHHIHPRAKLKDVYPKAEINDLANLAFISAAANKRISDRSPKDYFPELTENELTGHFVPLDPALRTVEAYPRFLAARRSVLAAAMTGLLDRFRPAWLDAVAPVASDDIEGCSLRLERYESEWDEPKMLIEAVADGARWLAVVRADDFNEIIAQACDGISGDLDVGEHKVTVRSDNDVIEVDLGPLLVYGTGEEWQAVVQRERADALPLSQLPAVPPPPPWEAARRRFPAASSE